MAERPEPRRHALISILVVLASGLASVIMTVQRGPLLAFAWVYSPVFFLVPTPLVVNLPGLPDLNARAAVLIPIAISILANRAQRTPPPRDPYITSVVVACAVSFSLSFAATTDALGFFHRVIVLGMEWLLPYFVVRSLLTSWDACRVFLVPFSLSAVVLSGFGMYEARMRRRLAIELWNSVGAGLWLPHFFDSMRWGFLRAWGTFGHAIALGTALVTTFPLVAL